MHHILLIINNFKYDEHYLKEEHYWYFVDLTNYVLLTQTQFKTDRRKKCKCIIKNLKFQISLFFLKLRLSRQFLYLEPHSNQSTQLTQNNYIHNNNFMLYGACFGRVVGESTINSLSWDVEICRLPSKKFFALPWKVLKKERRGESPFASNTESVRVVQWGRTFHCQSVIQVLW